MPKLYGEHLDANGMQLLSPSRTLNSFQDLRTEDEDISGMRTRRSALWRVNTAGTLLVSCWWPELLKDDPALLNTQVHTAELYAASLARQNMSSVSTQSRHKVPKTRPQFGVSEDSSNTSSRSMHAQNLADRPNSRPSRDNDLAILQTDPNLRRCPRCGQSFGQRKTLLRHIRTVHRSKAFRCSYCAISFSRNDTRNRHESEIHCNGNNIIKCANCGRYISRRALAEHLESVICQHAHAVSSQNQPMDRKLGYIVPDEDPFLATLRMLRLFGPDTENETVGYVRLRLVPRRWERDVGTIQYESIIANLLVHQLQKSDGVSRASGMAALLLGFMAIAGQKEWGGKAAIHFEGAATIFKTRHDIVCDCGDHRLCQNWSPYRPKSPELGLLNRLLKDIGVEHKLVPAYTPEDEAILTRTLARRRYRGSNAEYYSIDNEHIADLACGCWGCRSGTQSVGVLYT